MGILGYRSWGGIGRRTLRRPTKRFRRLTVPEPLEDRALPGGSLLELLLGAPLLSPFLGSSWADGGLTPSNDLPDLEARARNRTAAFHELLANPHALEQTVTEVRNLVQIASTQAQAADAQEDAFPGSEGEGTGASAGDFPGLEPWWDDPGWLGELEAVLRELARAGSRWEFDGLGGPVLEQPGGLEVPQSELGDPLTAGDFPGELPVEGDPGGGGGMATLDYGGGYGGNEPPVAGNDQAYCGIDGGVTIFVLGNDYDPDDDDFAVTGVSQPGHGSAAVGYGGGSVVYTPEPGYTSGNDSFQYTLTDEHGASSQAVVTVSRVQVTGFTLQREMADGGWAGVLDGEVCWSHDTLEWTAQYTPSGTPGLTMATWWKKEWTAPDLPGNWGEFAARVAQPVEKNPGMGDWAIRPDLCFTPPAQTPFWVNLATPEHRVVAQISGIRWETHSDPATAGEFDNDDGGMRLYPDAPAPGQGFHPDVDVVATVSPPLPQVQVVMQWYDVDDPTDHDGPIDTTDPPAQDPGYNQPDNKPTSGVVGPQIALSTPSAPNAQCEVRAVLTFGWKQPGNNVRVAVAGRAEELAPIKPLAPDDRSSLFFDKNGDGHYRTADGDYMLSEFPPSPSVWVTPTLTVWRKLHMEIDSMGPVTGNSVPSSAARVDDNHNGTSNVDLTLAGMLLDYDDNQFENGRLREDSTGRVFVIMESHVDRVIVYNNGQTIPSPGAITLWDDDTQVMPEMPDTGLMQQAYAAAFIAPIVDGGGNPANNKDNVSFQLNVPWTAQAFFAQIEADNGLESNGNRSAAFWIAYVQGAFQPNTEKDGDPNSEAGRAGGTPSPLPKKGSLVFLETAKDVARQCGFAEVQVFVQRVVAHEIAHQFNVGDEQGPRRSMMHALDVHDPNVPEGGQFNESQRLTLRTREQSPGA